MKSFVCLFIALAFCGTEHLIFAQEPANSPAGKGSMPTKETFLKQRPPQPASATSASLPLKMSYQGLLTTSGGVPVADGAYDLTVALYDSLTTGTSQWSEAHPGVPVQHGTFSLVLGESTPLNLQFNKPLFVQLAATGGPAGPSYPLNFTPRSELLSSPYSLGPWVTKGTDVYYGGRVGIGSTAPESTSYSSSVRLEIADQNGGNSDLGMRVAGGGYPTQNLLSSRGTLQSPAASQWGDFAGTVEFRGYDGANFVHGAGIYAYIDSIPSAGIVPTALTFGTANAKNGYVERLHLDRNGNFIVDSWGYNAGSLNPGLIFGTDQNGGEGISSGRSAGNISGLDLYTNHFPRVSITHTGSVGIGTSTPSARLHVAQGNVRIDNPYGLELPGNGAYSSFIKMGIGENDLYTLNYAGGDMSFWTSTSIGSSIDRLHIKADGKVGIGTAAPANTLSVTGSADVSGSLSIGTSTPGEKLTVAGSMEVGTNAGDYQHLRIGGGNSSGFLYGSYPRYGDGIHIGYNAYGSTVGGLVVPNGGGGTSRLSLGYGYIGLYVGGVAADPSTLGIYVNSSGNVGIGTSSPTARLCVSGSIFYSSIAAGCSDIRYKNNIAPLASSLDKIVSLRGVSFDWRTDEFPDKNFPKERQIGLIAQEVEKVYPEVVMTDEKGYKGIDYSHLTAALIEAVKEQQKEIDELKKLVRSLSAKGAPGDKSMGSLK